jgi:hypothetical protein
MEEEGFRVMLFATDNIPADPPYQAGAAEHEVRWSNALYPNLALGEKGRAKASESACQPAQVRNGSTKSSHAVLTVL